MKNRLAALLVLLFMLFSFVACENVEYPSDDISEGSDRDVYDQLAGDLPNINEDGEILEEKTFYIITDDGTVFTQDESKAGTINDAVRKRDNFLREKYGANIKVRVEKTKNIINELSVAAAADNEFCDMIAISAKDTVGLYLDGMLCDMNSLPNFDPQSEYLDKNNATSLALNSEFYILADPTTRYFNEIYTMFYNRNLVISAGCENPESLVSQGKWTWDKFSEIEKTVAAEVNNKTVADLNNDVFGFASYYKESNYGQVMWVSCDSPMIDNTYKNKVDFSLSVDDAATIGKYLYKVNDSKSVYPYDGELASRAFKNGRLVFFTNKLGYLSSIRDGSSKGEEFGVLPIPKYNESQESYSCLVDSAARVIAVPKTVLDDEQSHKAFVGAVITGMCAISGKTVREAYLSDTIIKFLNNNEEAVMLKTVLDSARFDFCTVYGSKISTIYNATVNAICEYIDVGSDMRNTLLRNIDALRDYADSKFN